MDETAPPFKLLYATAATGGREGLSKWERGRAKSE
jgi:hypothetical protein